MKIVFYTSGCPKCAVLKKKLDDKGINYTVFSDVEKMVEMGMTEMPMLSVDNKLMDFQGAIKWVNER